MMTTLRPILWEALFVSSALTLAAGCTPDNGWGDSDPPADGGPDAAVEIPDEDYDGISDANEGRDSGVDTDGDGTPDYLDTDSDDDGIPDGWESGSAGDPSRAPRDSDGDGTPDFRDVDSDGNGIFDFVEGAEDLDNDGIGDWADADNDGDHVTDVLELGGNPSVPLDSDGDGTPDYEDLDSDNDTISDLQEHTEDFDDDGVPDRLDEDSDGDGILDEYEAGDRDLETPPVDTDGDLYPDFRDEDSDADGLSDRIEWEQAATMGTDFQNDDSDGDGVSDMIEWAAGTGIGDPADSPLTRGNFVFVVPYEDEPDPEDDTLDFSTTIQIADVYFLVDRTGSMSEIDVMRDRLSEIIEQVTCAVGEDPTATGCIPDLWVGFGWFTESDSGPDSDGLSSFTNIHNLTADFAAVQSSIPTVTTSGSDECQRKAVYCAAHGPGDHCPGDAQNLDSFPCPEGHVGFPCFRPDAARVLTLVTDEGMNQDTSTHPTFAEVGAALLEASITFVGIDAEEDGDSTVDNHLAQVARASGQPAGSELVFRGDDTAVVDTVVAAIDAAANVPIDVGATPVDDPADAVDATLFIEYLEVNLSGAASCTAWPDVADSSGDGHADRFIQLAPGTPVCWDVNPAINTFVEPTDEPQMFRATIVVRGGPGETLLDRRDVYFLVPPELYEPPPE